MEVSDNNLAANLLIKDKLPTNWFVINRPIPLTTRLTFFMREGMLFLNDKYFAKAFSGGGGGHAIVSPKKAKRDGVIYNDKAVNNPDYTYLKEIDVHHYNPVTHKKVFDRYIQRGGPIPCGSYIITNLSTRAGFSGKVPALLPDKLWDRNVKGNNYRDGLLIHGSAEKGSDGCLVLPDGKLLKELFAQIALTKGGMLEVYEDLAKVKHQFDRRKGVTDIKPDISTVA